MASNSSHRTTTPQDLEHSAAYTRLPDHPHSPASHSRPLKGVAGVLLSLLFLSSLVALILYQDQHPQYKDNHGKRDLSTPLMSVVPESSMPPSRGVAQGVSEKAVREFYSTGPVFPWTNAMLAWQRTAYHFQPMKNWMNDPNGPLYHLGWYHLFYQYNPDSAIWGNITWGHAVSKDLIHWLYLPLAMVPDHWFDYKGTWTGSATLLPDGQIIILYTGDTDDSIQVQNLAYPANLSDPLLLKWVKYEDNPVIIPPTGIQLTEFRDPTTAWYALNSTWRVAIGSKVNGTGVILVYETTNFTSFDLLDGFLHAVPGTGMWECVDFYPVPTNSTNGLDNSVHGPGVKHVLKASLDDDKKDFYALGTYNPSNNTWTPDDPEMDVGIGLRVDYGKYYASKTFYDQIKQRRILWGWIGETDNAGDDILKGWASVQDNIMTIKESKCPKLILLSDTSIKSIPRTVVLDLKTGTNIIQWPVEEVEELRLNNTEYLGVELAPGSVVPLNITSATQLDISATFEVDEAALEGTLEADVGYNCSTTGATVRGTLGPFGLLVIADDSLTEFTPVYFYISKGTDGSYQTFFCSDEIRSSNANDINKRIYGGTVPVLDGEILSMRLLVDHSIVESFAQGGRTVVTSRIYPTKAIYGAARVFLFNNATGVNVTASVNIWSMDSAYIHPYPLDNMYEA